MKTVDIYEIGEEVYIKAKIDDILIENGEPKYKVSPEAAAESLAHKYSHKELHPVPERTKYIEIDEKINEYGEVLERDMEQWEDRVCR